MAISEPYLQPEAKQFLLGRHTIVITNIIHNLFLCSKECYRKMHFNATKIINILNGGPGVISRALYFHKGLFSRFNSVYL